MTTTKTELRFFTVPEWEKEEAYLRQRHQEGWQLVRVTFPGLYHFQRCQPEDVVYQLDYNPEGLAHKADYVGLFQDCGWEYLQDYVGYSYFRKARDQMAEEETIFCDSASRMEMVERVYKGKMLPLLFLFLFVILPNLYLQAAVGNGVLLALFALALVLYLVIFFKFSAAFRRCREALSP